jgi:hypothetical protein
MPINYVLLFLSIVALKNFSVKLFIALAYFFTMLQTEKVLPMTNYNFHISTNLFNFLNKQQKLLFEVSVMTQPVIQTPTASCKQHCGNLWI